MFNLLSRITLYRMCELEELSRTCGPSVPGIAKMYAVDTHDVVAIPSPNANFTITSNIILKPGKYFKDIPFVEQEAGLTDDIADAVNGGFKKNIPLKLSKYSPQNNKWIYNAIGARFIVIIADNQGQMILVGDLIAAMRLEKATGATGQKNGDKNGWDMNLTAEGVKPCFFYTGTVVLQDAVQSWDTVLDFTSSVTDSKENVTGVVPATNSVQKFKFNKKTAIGLPLAMTVYLGGDNVTSETFRAEYAGDPFEYVHTDGNSYFGNFTAGNVNL